MDLSTLFQTTESGYPTPLPINDSFATKLMKGIFGTDENGNVKKLDLGSIIQPPEVVLKADKQQGLIILAVVALFAFMFIKKRKRK